MPKLVSSNNKLATDREKSARYLLSTTRLKKGFTLIELLVVITIISILLAITTFSYTQAQKKGRDGKRKADLKAIQQALELYYQDNGKYPGATNGLITCNTTTDNGVTRNWGTQFTCDSVNYLDLLPEDPKTTPQYYYTSSGTPPQTYIVSAFLENANDPDKNNLPCTPYTSDLTPPATRNYCVKNP